jgi:antitoxin MazE
VIKGAMKVLKWDDDLAVLLPEELVEQMGLSDGDELRIVEVVEQTLVVEKVEKQPIDTSEGERGSRGHTV